MRSRVEIIQDFHGLFLRYLALPSALGFTRFWCFVVFLVFSNYRYLPLKHPRVFGVYIDPECDLSVL